MEGSGSLYVIFQHIVQFHDRRRRIKQSPDPELRSNTTAPPSLHSCIPSLGHNVGPLRRTAQCLVKPLCFIQYRSELGVGGAQVRSWQFPYPCPLYTLLEYIASHDSGGFTHSTIHNTSCLIVTVTSTSANIVHWPSAREISTQDPAKIRVMSVLPMAPPAKGLLAHYRLLSPTASVRVSPLCLGGMNFGNAWSHYSGLKFQVLLIISSSYTSQWAPAIRKPPRTSWISITSKAATLSTRPTTTNSRSRRSGSENG